MLILHSFWLSLATYRVRIALQLKGIPFEERAHDLTKGEHRSPEFWKLNPAGAVPALEGGTQEPLTQSLAILEWLEESYPTPSLLPPDAQGSTRCHGETLSIADLALASHLIGVARFGVDLTEFPRTAAVGESLFALPEFAAAHPRLQLGAPED